MRRMAEAQFWFDTICATIFFGGCGTIFVMLSAPWPK